MTKQEAAHYRRLLEEKRTAIMQDLGLIETHSMKATSADSSGDLVYSDHMSELGSDAMEREKAFLFASRDGTYISQLEDALRRIDEGTLGVCRECGKEIPKERMEAVPTTTICVPCKEADQRQQRRSA